LSNHGQSSGILIDETEGFPSRRHFGHPLWQSDLRLPAIAYEPQIELRSSKPIDRLRKQHPEIVVGDPENWSLARRSMGQTRNHSGSMMNCGFPSSWCRHITTLAGSSRWLDTTGFQPEAGHHHRRSQWSSGASGIIICCRALT